MRHHQLLLTLLLTSACSEAPPSGDSQTLEPDGTPVQSEPIETSIAFLSASRTLVPLTGKYGTEMLIHNGSAAVIEEKQRRGDFAETTELEFAWTAEPDINIIAARILDDTGRNLYRGNTHWRRNSDDRRFTVELMHTTPQPNTVRAEIDYTGPAVGAPITVLLDGSPPLPLAVKVGEIDVQIQSMTRSFGPDGTARVEVELSYAEAHKHRLGSRMQGRSAPLSIERNSAGSTTTRLTFLFDEFRKSPITIPVQIPLQTPLTTEVDGSTLVIRSLEWSQAEGGQELVATLGYPANEISVRLASGQSSTRTLSATERRWRFDGAGGVLPANPLRNSLIIIREDGPFPAEMQSPTLELYERSIETSVFEGLPLP